MSLRTLLFTFQWIYILKNVLFAANFFCTELYFLPLVLLLYFHFINERIVPTFSYLSTQERMSYIILSCSTIKSRFLFGLYAVQTITSDTSLTIASYTYLATINFGWECVKLYLLLLMY